MHTIEPLLYGQSIVENGFPFRCRMSFVKIAGFDNLIGLPAIVSGNFNTVSITYELSLGFTILYNSRNMNMQIGISKVATDLTNYPSINFNVSHDFYF